MSEQSMISDSKITAAQPDRLIQLAFGMWWLLLFIQPFEKFVAVKYLLMVGLLVVAIPLGMRQEVRQRLRQRNMVLGLGLAILVWSLAVSVASPYPEDSLHALSRDLLLQAELLIFGWLLVSSTKEAKTAVWAIIGGFSAVSLLSGFEVVSYLKEHALSEGMIPRSHRSYYGGYANMAGFCLPLVVAFGIACAESNAKRFGLGLLVALGLVLTGLYGSRSSLLVIAISIVLLFGLRKMWKLLGALFLIGAIAALWVGSQKDLGYLERYRSMADTDTYVTNQGWSARFDVWSGVLEVIEARPLLGYGYGWKKLAWAINEGGYAERWRETDPGKRDYFFGEHGKVSYGRVNPHNYFLQIVFETGWPGLALVMAFWIAVFWLGFKGLVSGRSEFQGLCAVILVTLFAYMLSNVANGFWVGGLANMACALVGILVGLALNEQPAADGGSK